MANFNVSGDTMDLAHGLAPDDREYIAANAMKLRFKPDDVLFRDGDACSNFVMVLSGSIKVQKVSENGRQIVLYRVDHDNVCILTTSCLIGNSAYNAEGVAEGEVEALALSKAHFKELMDRSSTFREAIFASLAAKISSLIVKIDEISFLKIGVRLAKALEKHAARSGGQVVLSHQELADELGTAREVVSRQLKEFERRGWITVGRKAIELLNPRLSDEIVKLEIGD